MQGHFWLLSVQGHFEVIQSIPDFSYFQQPCIAKVTGCRGKWTVKCSKSQFEVIQVIPDFSYFQQPCIAKVTGRRGKWTKIWVFMVVYVRYFWLLRFQSQSEVIRYICKISIFCNLVSKNGWPYSQTDENMGLGGDHFIYTGYFWLLSAQWHSQVIWCISDYGQLCISKMVGRRGKRYEIWDSGILVLYMRHLWTETEWNLGLVDTSNTYIVYSWPGRIQGQFGVIRCTIFWNGL